MTTLAQHKQNAYRCILANRHCRTLDNCFESGEEIAQAVIDYLIKKATVKLEYKSLAGTHTFKEFKKLARHNALIEEQRILRRNLERWQWWRDYLKTQELNMPQIRTDTMKKSIGEFNMGVLYDLH